MNLWKNYIVKGNERFAANDLEAADALYRAAKREAESLFETWKDANEAVSALVVTWHNIADLYQRQGDTAAARETLENIHKKMLRNVLATNLSDTRHSALYRGSIETYSALLIHKNCYKDCREISRRTIH